jgi:GTP-binding protein EngB required for normal cell division
VTNIADYIATDYPSYGYVDTNKGFNDKWSGFVENQVLKVIFTVTLFFVEVLLT